jgi:RNA polymerase sigma-70 factor, ECF subfamily
MVPSDAELLQLVVIGDEQAFTALYRRHQSFVYRFALLMSGQASIAEEVTQEVFLALLRQADRYDPGRGSLTAYLCGTARNQVLRLIERERPYLQLVEESSGGEALPVAQPVAEDDPFNNLTRNETIKMVRQAVLALPLRYREVVVLCDFQEMSRVEAALALDCPVGTVNSRLNRGHALLLKKLRAAARLDPQASSAQGRRCLA